MDVSFHQELFKPNEDTRNRLRQGHLWRGLLHFCRLMRGFNDTTGPCVESWKQSEPFRCRSGSQNNHNR